MDRNLKIKPEISNKIKLSGVYDDRREKIRKLNIKIDFIKELPELVSHTIFGFLAPDDLESCLDVSKYWRSVGDCNSLWRKHCKDSGLDEHEPPNKTKRSYLCKLYNNWSIFRCSNEYYWKNRCWKYLELKNFAKFSLYCRNFFVEINKRTVKITSQLGEVTAQSKFIKLPFVTEVSRTISKISDRFAVFIWQNIILIYNCEDRFVFSNILALTESGKHIFSTEDHDLEGFVKDYSNHELWFTKIILEGQNLIFYRKENLYVLDLENLKITKTIEPDIENCELYIIDGYKVKYINHDKLLIIDNFEWYGIDWFLMNNTTIVLVNDTELAEVYDLTTMEFSFNILISQVTKYFLHTSEKILYSIEKNHIIAMSTQTGSNIWEIELSTFSDNVEYDWELVCEKFLVLFLCKTDNSTFYRHNTFYVLDAFSGKLMYSALRPPGIVKLVDHSMMVINNNKTTSILYFN